VHLVPRLIGLATHGFSGRNPWVVSCIGVA
jgi:hypothetical protein